VNLIVDIASFNNPRNRVKTSSTPKTAGIRLPVGARDFSLFRSVQTGSGVPQSPIQWVPRILSPGVKWQGLEANHSPPASAEVKNGGVIPPLPFKSSWLSA
jgi:hypothetical protein